MCDSLLNRILPSGFRIVVFSILVLTGCGDSPAKKTGPVPLTNSSDKSIIQTVPADTLIISQEAAVFFTADSARRQALKQQMGDNPFDGVDHECFYQMKNSRTSLREHWPKIRIYEIHSDIVLLFIRNDGSVLTRDLRNQKDLCGLILFKPEKTPVPADMMGIGTSLENYFLH